MDTRVRIIQEGTGLHKPNDRANVTVTVECRENEETRQIILSKETHQITLGEPDSDLWDAIERCILIMRNGEESEFIIKAGFEQTSVWCQIHLESFQRATDSWKLSPHEKLSIATHHKTSGNDHFKSKNYVMAARRYSKSLKYVISIGYDVMDSDDAVVCQDLKMACLNNLAACQLKLHLYKHSINNSTKVLEVQPKNSKALYRRGIAYLQIKDFDLAELDLLIAKELEPESQAVIGQLKILNEERQSSNKKLQEGMKKMFGETKQS